LFEGSTAVQCNWESEFVLSDGLLVKVFNGMIVFVERNGERLEFFNCSADP
jgi:hypothetical protein